MKKEFDEEEHCPHCKRHCPLSSPHCKLGKALAEEKKKEVKMKKEVKKKKETKKTKDVKKPKEGKIKEKKSTKIEFLIEPSSEKDQILFHLLKKCSKTMPYGKDGKKSKRMKSAHNPFSILSEEEKVNLELILEKLYQEWNK